MKRCPCCKKFMKKIDEGLFVNVYECPCTTEYIPKLGIVPIRYIFDKKRG